MRMRTINGKAKAVNHETHERHENKNQNVLVAICLTEFSDLKYEIQLCELSPEIS